MRRPSTPRPTLGQLAASVRGLTLRCHACDRGLTFPIKALIEKHGRDAIAADIAQRFSCGQCRGRAMSWWEYPGQAGAPTEFRY